MIILGIETSCDETAAALLGEGRILSSVVSSQVEVHAQYGGVVPELASREHVQNICFVVERCLGEARIDWSRIEAVAATRGPGLVGALLVGLTYAKALAYALDVPFLGVHHLEGHLASIFLDHPRAELPALALVVSGGHTSLFLLEDRTRRRLLARTRDDAAGEALDKLSKYLGLGYPGGPLIDRISPLGDARAVPFTLPRFRDGSLDFSFSGLKTAALRYLHQQQIPRLEPGLEEHPERIPQDVLDLVASYQKAVIEQIMDRVSRALENHAVRSVHFSGGVSCNTHLREEAARVFTERGLPVYFPRPELTTDNAAMIAAAARGRLEAGERDPWDLEARANLDLVP